MSVNGLGGPKSLLNEFRDSEMNKLKIQLTETAIAVNSAYTVYLNSLISKGFDNVYNDIKNRAQVRTLMNNYLDRTNGMLMRTEHRMLIYYNLLMDLWEIYND